MGRQPDACELCQRKEILTKHHLIPRSMHQRKSIQKQLSRAEMQTRLLWVCRCCHNYIHLLFDEKELALYWNTRGKLLASDSIQKFIQWLVDKPVGFKVRFRR